MGKIANCQSLAILDRGLKSQPFSQFGCIGVFKTKGPKIEKKKSISIEIFNLAWKFQSRLKFSILDLQNSPQKIGVWWVARLKFSISIENFNPGGRSWIFSIFGPLGYHHIRAPPHKNHDEHRQCNPARGVHFAVLLGSDNSYTTPFEVPFLIQTALWWRYMVGDPLYRHFRNY